MNKKKATSYLGLALRAGKLTIGRSATVHGCKRSSVKLVFLTHDASDKLQRELTKYDIPVHILTDISKFDLGNLLGRREVVILGVCDDHFAQALSTP